MEHKPLVSILIPAYNRPEYLRLALDSALNQTYSNIEIIICDDSTNTDVANMLQPYLAQYPAIRYFKNEQVLFVKNWHKCFELANGDYVNYLMDDDLFHPEKIERMMDCFLERRDVTLVTSYRQLIDDAGNYLAPVYATRRLFHEKTQLSGIEFGNEILTHGYNVIGEPTTVLFRKKDLLEPYGILRGRQYTTINDLASWLSLLARGQAVYLPETLSYFRIHAGQNQKSAAIGASSLGDWSELTLAAREEGFLQNDAQYRTALTLQTEQLMKWLADPDYTPHYTTILELLHRLNAIQSSLGLKIDIGCGLRKQPGYIGLDHGALPGVDIVCDLNGTLPLEDNTVDYVMASHSLEHLDHLLGTMKEIYRVCKHKAIVCIVAPYHNTALNLANPYHKQVFNEHTPRFFTTVNSTLVPYEDYEFPHAVVWGLGESDHSVMDIDFRCVRMEFFYFPAYVHLSASEQRRLRNSQANVVDQIMYHLVVNKTNISQDELLLLAHSGVLEEPDHVTMRRNADRAIAAHVRHAPTGLTASTGPTALSPAAELNVQQEVAQLQAKFAAYEEQLAQLTHKLLACEKQLERLNR